MNKPGVKLRLSQFMLDVVLTAITALATTASLIFVSRFLAQGLGPEGFGIYSIARRFVASLLPCSTLAMNQTIARYVATAQSMTERLEVLKAGLFLSLIATLLVCAVCWPFRGKLSILIFHNIEHIPVITALLFMLVGNAFYMVLYGYYRGAGAMHKANLWQIISYAVGPIMAAALLAQSGRVDWILIAMGSLCLLAAIPLTIFVMSESRHPQAGKALRNRMSELLHYGSGRAVGGLVIAGLFACGPLMAPYFGSVEDAGYLAIGQSVFSLSEAGVVAFGLVVLPKAAQLVAEGRKDFLRERIGDIVALILHLGLFVTCQVLIWADLIVAIWLGDQYRVAVPIMRLLLIAVTPYLAYTLLRSIVDAVEERAVNTRNLLIALGVNLFVSILLAQSPIGVLGIAVGTATGFIVLGASTLIYLRKENWIGKPRLLVVQCMSLNLTALVIAWGMKLLFDGSVSSILGQALLVFCVEIVLFLSYLYALLRLKAGWIEQVAIRVLRRQTTAV